MEVKQTECIICAEKYNKSQRSPVTCTYCNFEACRSCCQTFLLNESRPHCMNRECDHEWTRKFLAQNFTNAFLTKEYKKHREEVLWNHERSLLPATQPLVEQRIQVEGIQNEIRANNRLIMELKEQLYNLNTQNILHQRNIQTIVNYQTVTDVKSHFVRACPVEECRGFLSSQWKCGLCNQWTCPECHEVKGPERDTEHTCKPENVETAKLIARDTRPCPKCGMGIHRISGCDQVWCTLCHTAFSYRTGRIETNHIHNPHYYEWMRQNAENGEIPREPGDIPGGQPQCREEVLNHQNVSRFYYHMIDSKFSESVSHIQDHETRKEMVKVFGKLRDRFAKCGRNILHLREVELPRYQFDQLTANQELRIRYMRNDIDEDRFRALVQQNEKKMAKKQEIYNVFQFVITAGSDILFRALERTSNIYFTLEEIKAFNRELINLKKYANECLDEVSNIYKSVKITLTPSFKLEEPNK